MYRKMTRENLSTYSKKNLSQCHFVQHTSYMDWPWIEPGLPRLEAGDKPPEPWHSLIED
jgi:hypothetical protein